MNTARRTLLGLAIAMVTSTCFAQNATIPFRQLEREAQLTASLAQPGNETDSSSLVSSSLNPGIGVMEPSAAGFTRTIPASPVRVPRIVDPKFVLLNGLHLGMAILDVGLTQHCIADHHCREGNPMMPSSLAGQLSVNFALVSYGSFVSYRLKKHRSNLWGLSPAVGISAHAVGVATGIMHE
jgi:hypothetical protein